MRRPQPCSTPSHMMRPLWPLLTLAAAAADKNKQLVAPAAAAPDQRNRSTSSGTSPNAAACPSSPTWSQKLHLTSCFGRKAVVAKGENWTHAMERGRCNFVNTEQWQGEHGGMVISPRPPRVAILVRDPVARAVAVRALPDAREPGENGASTRLVSMTGSRGGATR